MRWNWSMFLGIALAPGLLQAQSIPVTVTASLLSESGKPLPIVGRFWFIFESGRDSVPGLTDGAGRARVNLPLGNYRLRSHQRVTLAGRTYYWDLPVSVRSTMLVELNATNAQDAPPAAEPSALVMDAPVPPPARGPEAPPVADAPPPTNTNVREGFWIGFGLGYGWLSCDGCDWTGALSGTLRLGGTLSPTVRLGVSTNGWYKTEDEATLSMGNASLVLTAYSSETSGFHFLVGGGVSVLGASLSGFGSDSEVGPGGVIGLGYDAMVAKSFALTPYVNFVGASFNGEFVHFLQIGIAATWP